MITLLPAPLVLPSTEPVTVTECKLDSRIDGTEFDTLIPALIAAAREMCEQETGRKLITQTWRLTADDWPSLTGDTFSLLPFQSASVSYWDGVDWSVLPGGWVITDKAGALSLQPSWGASFPALANLVGPRVRIDVVCGYGDTAASVPASLRMWIRAHVAAMLRSPDGLGDEKKMAPMQYLQGLIDPHKVYA